MMTTANGTALGVIAPSDGGLSLPQISNCLLKLLGYNPIQFVRFGAIGSDLPLRKS
jgi:hypothetical protein